MGSLNRGLIVPVLVVIWYNYYYIIITVVSIYVIVISIINFFISAVHVIQQKVSWTNKQLTIVTQKPEKSRRTTETAIGKKRKKSKEAEEEMIKKLATEGSAVRNESSLCVPSNAHYW